VIIERMKRNEGNGEEPRREKACAAAKKMSVYAIEPEKKAANARAGARPNVLRVAR
jgi:hypothetical protein